MKYRMPAEWAEHERVWVGFPWDDREWPGSLERAQDQVAAFANAVFDGGGGEDVYLITGSENAAKRARSLVDKGVHVQNRRIGDCWLRDTGCIIVHADEKRIARNFRFNGWGGKFLMTGDNGIGRKLAEDAALEVVDCDWILEGGAIEVDGHGLGITTEQCLLNPNRNPGLAKADIENFLLRDLGIEKLLWLGKGLTGDHTDGHVDNLARFVAPGKVALPRASAEDDPNAAIYADARGRAIAFGLEVIDVPSPGRVGSGASIQPASYLNFLIGNNVVAVPKFGVAADREAIATLEPLFPDRTVVGLTSDAILAGGGSFHCCSQQVPV